MSKFEPYSRREFKRNREAWMRRNSRLLLIIAAGLVALLALVTVIILKTWLDNASKWYALGLLHAGLVAAAAQLVHTGFLAHNPEVIGHLRGAWGEENTRSELQRAKRKRLIWGWVDSINLQAGDLDHLVVTRNGGLVVLDSKWRSQTNADGAASMTAAANTARLRAEGVARSVLRSERGARHRARVGSLTVQPVVVLWGEAQHAVPDGAEIDGVRFVGGRRLVTWLGELEGQQVSKDAALDVLKRLEDFRASAWQEA